MLRRDFTALIGAGLLFPQKLIKSCFGQEKTSSFQKTAKKGLAGMAEVQDLPYLTGIKPDKIVITCLGSEEEPATEEQIKAYSREVSRHLVSRKNKYGIPIPLPLDCHFTQHYLEVPYLVLAIGSEARPATSEDIKEFREEVVHRLGQGENWIITHHAVTPYRYHPRVAGRYDRCVSWALGPYDFHSPQITGYANASITWKNGFLVKHGEAGFILDSDDAMS